MTQTVTRLSIAWRRLTQRLEQRAAGERVVLCALVLAVVWLLLDALWLGGLQTSVRAERSRLSQAQTQLAEVKARQQVLDLLLHHDPDQAMRSRQAQLKSEWDASDARWGAARQSLLPPEQSVRLMADLLQTLPALEKLEWTVLHVQAAGPGSGAVASVAEPPAPASVTNGTPTLAAPQPLLWRQSVRLRVRGSYPDVARYVRLLEDLPYRVQCDKLLLSTPVDPAAPHRVTATLLISTLSFEDRWLAF
ncbi:hypothetical protein PSQ40_19390 [Curvibacter sp. HBC61]|uniref:Agglutinin biogenesis protein n=1 Tax=Curvibacter cyanobacteriorum TaxID=3026422 RepID=A0ABT5N355_9BURK|nr:hypothetical protein [Curvibacter sp. HBC61]MDD0840749.1 hypothetical protein [Curvibacter sp. HBC61]